MQTVHRLRQVHPSQQYRAPSLALRSMQEGDDQRMCTSISDAVEKDSTLVAPMACYGSGSVAEALRQEACAVHRGTPRTSGGLDLQESPRTRPQWPSSPRGCRAHNQWLSDAQDQRQVGPGAPSHVGSASRPHPASACRRLQGRQPLEHHHRQSGVDSAAGAHAPQPHHQQISQRTSGSDVSKGKSGKGHQSEK